MYKLKSLASARKHALTRRRDTLQASRFFCSWFADNRGRFGVSVFIQRMPPGDLRLHVQGLAKEVRIHVTGNGIAALVAVGYVCCLCKEGERVVFPSLEDFWHDHIFETFLDWVNTKLISSHCLNVIKDDGCTSARLIKDEAEVELHKRQLAQLTSGLIKIDGTPARPHGPVEVNVANVPLWKQHPQRAP